ncbi:MmyB family transcriptional regulator [Streptomyces sp. NPDC002426]
MAGSSSSVAAILPGPEPSVAAILPGPEPSDAARHDPSCSVTAPGGRPRCEDWPATQRNLGRYLFLHPSARELLPAWENQIRHCVSRLRALAGIDPDAPDLTRYTAQPGTPDHDAMLLLDLAAAPRAAGVTQGP